jgi:predicted neuraminidase
MFQGIPGIERAANGRLWATWYGGGVTEDRDNYVMLVTSEDDGQSWSGPKLVIDPDGPGPVRAFDPCLWHDPQGRLWLFWNQKLCNQKKEFPEELERRWYLWGMHTEGSGGANPEWSAPKRLGEAIMMNKPTVLSTGEWLLCSADWFWDRSARVFRSTNQGESWEHWGRAHVPEKTDRSFDEHMVVERNDGSLWMLVRTRYGIGESVSPDGGLTWSYVQPSAIAHVNSRFFIRRLRSGNLILVKHGTAIGEKTEKRSHLTAFLSGDDGSTWQGGLLLDDRVGVSYPDGVEADDGSIFIVYDFDRRGEKEIVFSRITEEDIRAGRVVSAQSRLCKMINKALGHNPTHKGGGTP